LRSRKARALRREANGFGFVAIISFAQAKAPEVGSEEIIPVKRRPQPSAPSCAGELCRPRELHLASASGANQPPIAALAPNPKLQCLRAFVNLVPIDAVARPSQQFRQVDVSQTAECTEIQLITKVTPAFTSSNSCAERFLFKAHIKESLDRLWTYRYEGALLNYLQRWIKQVRWQRLKPFQKLRVPSNSCAEPYFLFS
jgi:hypothetical protein